MIVNKDKDDNFIHYAINRNLIHPRLIEILLMYVIKINKNKFKKV